MFFLYFVVFIGFAVYLKNLSERMSRIEKLLERKPHAQTSFENTNATLSSPASVAPIRTQDLQLPNMQVSDTSQHTKVSAVQWVAGVGALALLFGIAFFFKFAIDQGWLTEWMRLALGFLVGSLLLVLGGLWRDKYKQYAQVLVGGGLAILYFTIYASFQFYAKIDQPVAFLLTIVVTLLGIGLSYWHHSRALVFLAVLGGFISPFLVSNGQDNQVALFMYLSILNFGVLLIFAKDFWLEVLYLSFFATILHFSWWAVSFSSHENFPASVIFLSLNYIVFAILNSVTFRKTLEEKKLPKEAGRGLGLAFALWGVGLHVALSFLMYESAREFLPLVLLLLGCITFLAYALVDRLEDSDLNFPVSLLGYKFVLAGVLWQFTGAVENLYLLLAVAVGLAVGLLVKRRDLKFWGLVFLTLVTIKVMLFSEFKSTFLFNSQFGLQILVAIALLAVAFAFEKWAVSDEEKRVPSLSRALAGLVIWLGVTQEISEKFTGLDSRNLSTLLLSVWWLVYAVVLAVVGGFKKFRIFRRGSVLLFGLVVLKVFLYDVQALTLGYRIVSFILLGVILLSLAFFYQSHKERLHKFWEGETSIS